MRPQITQKTPIQTQTLPQAVSSARLLLMAEDADPKPHNCAGVFLARNMIGSANQRYRSTTRRFLTKNVNKYLL